MLDLYEELRGVTGALETAGIPYALVGGLAVSIYATPRATQDIDLLLAAGDLPIAAAVLHPLGYDELSAAMVFAQGRLEIRRFTRLESAQFLMVDLLLPQDEALADILARRQRVGGTLPLWIAPLDGLVALKRLRGSAQDLADIVALGEQP